MAVDHHPACPVRAGFDPLSDEFLADPYAVMASLPLDETPVFYAPALDGYVVTRYEDIEAVFLDPQTYSAAAAQLPLVPLVPEAAEILLAGGHKPQPSMVSLDPHAHAPPRLARVHAAPRDGHGAARARDAHRAARRGRPRGAVRPRPGAHVP